MNLKLLSPLLPELPPRGRKTRIHLRNEQFMRTMFSRKKIEGRTVSTKADKDFVKSSSINQSLREFVARRMRDPPVMKEMLIRSRDDAIENRIWESIGLEYIRSTDAGLSEEAERQFIQEFLFDADIDDGGILGNAAAVLGLAPDSRDPWSKDPSILA